MTCSGSQSAGEIPCTTIPRSRWCASRGSKRERDPFINVQFIVDAGDLDNDGKKEFLAGGLKPNAPFVSYLHVFEAVADNDFQIVATFIRSNTTEAYSSANIADVDGDGRKEIVFGTASNVAIYENIGDNAWEEIWDVSLDVGVPPENFVCLDSTSRSRIASPPCGGRTRSVLSVGIRGGDDSR